MGTEKVVILAVGSFNPPTNGHLCMMEDAKYSLEKSGKIVLEGIMSPVSDGYAKKSLISAKHRLAQTEAATYDSDWIHASGWECAQSEWTATVNVLKHHQQDVKNKLGSDVNVLLLFGGDVIESFDKFYADGTPVWDREDVEEIISAGIVVRSRPGSDPEQTLKKLNLNENSDKVHFIKNAISSNSISSTSLRAALKEHRSIKYTTPDSVIKYIKDHRLYE
ncbi:Nicotinamide-nucleotide adenylyltransferase [Caenorhabditis elegans]|uniref:Nicotinamide-nucleotide adenylyltransferase n=1 Tax=Caenorhabditis elegans TaxID=6239 RepID=Q9XXM2_CAEEL|nr:Nicotinamide-nucleotide adenylyltransferase [Caenorhabditis elegans]CAA18360.2 Nicotinamide-nucleotide adenylyltransferase [Caenorhabditis elegans]|eukprot:NP_510010.2 Nicotinamide-nucleotide adenylyltransferase [Caenorhabditis elegans]